jgi:drug/metabolite transporter (DMT)-like permease
MIAAFFTTLLFSISAVCGNRAAKLLGGTEANFWRLVIAATVLAVYSHAFGAGLGGAAFITFFISGCIGFGVGDQALFQTLPRLGSRLSVMLTLCLSSPMAALLEWLWFGTSLSAAEIICALVILAGVALALAPGGHLRIGRRELPAGLALGSLAAICQALGAVLSRKAFALARAAGESIDGITAAYQRILGGVAVTALVLLWVKREAIAGHVARSKTSSTGMGETSIPRWSRAWPWVIANALAGPALGVSCYQWALKTTPTGIVLPIVAITPLVIIPFSYHLEGERPSGRSLAGGALAVCGAAVLAWISSRSR